MKTKVRGRYENGPVELTGPTPEWVDGTELDIGPHRNGVHEDDDYDDERIETPEEIEAWIAAVEAIPPLEFTPEEEERFNLWQTEHKKFEIEQVRMEFQNGIPGAP